MRTLRYLAAGVVAVLAAYAIYGLAWQPFRCNIVKNRVQRLLFQMSDSPNGPTVALTARRGIAEMQQCIAACPTDIDMYMTLAGHDRLIGRLQHAVDMYREALKYDRRPELFFNIGEVQFQMNQPDAALVSMTKACSFNMSLVDDLPTNYRETVVTAVQAQRARYRGDTLKVSIP